MAPWTEHSSKMAELELASRLQYLSYCDDKILVLSVHTFVPKQANLALSKARPFHEQ